MIGRELERCRYLESMLNACAYPDNRDLAMQAMVHGYIS